MKSIYTLIFFAAPFLSLAQKNEKFCRVKISRPFLEDVIEIIADSGMVDIHNRVYVTDSSGKRRSFKSEIAALNFIGSLGWKLVAVKPEFADIESSKGWYLFKKEE